MIAIKDERKRFELPSEKLARARRLYVSLCAKAIIDQPQLIVLVAIRTKLAGLYSIRTGTRDAILYIAKRIYRQNITGVTYWDWFNETGLYSLWRNNSKHYQITKSGELKVIKKIRVRIKKKPVTVEEMILTGAALTRAEFDMADSDYF